MGSLQFTEQHNPDHSRISSIAVSTRHLIEVADQFSLKRPNRDEVHQGREVAINAIGQNIAEADTYLSIQEHSGICPLVFREEGIVTGMLAMLLLNQTGHRALRDGDFNAIKPHISHLSLAGECVSAVYGWGFVATTKLAGRALVGATSAYQKELFSSIDCYTRAATPDGKRVLVDALGYRSVPWPDETGLIWIPGKAEA